MTVGDGIFWSTIVVVVFISIVLLSKYGKWKAFGKGLGIVVLLSALASGGYWGWLQHVNRPQVTTSLNGISLGMTEVEVTLAKGIPTEPAEAKLVEDDKSIKKTLSYDDCFVRLRGPTEEDLVVTTVCDTKEWSTTKVAGIDTRTSENEVVRKLGQSPNTSVNEEGTIKILNYPKWKAAYFMQKGSVIQICITEESIGYRVEHPAYSKTTQEKQY